MASRRSIPNTTEAAKANCPVSKRSPPLPSRLPHGSSSTLGGLAFGERGHHVDRVRSLGAAATALYPGAIPGARDVVKSSNPGRPS